MAVTLSCHFYWEVLSSERVGLMKACGQLLLRDRTFFYLVTSRAFLSSAGSGEEGNGAPVER
jgi:hypothetical protein